MAETPTKLPVKGGAPSTAEPSKVAEWRPFDSLRGQVDRLFRDFERGFLQTPFYRDIDNFVHSRDTLYLVAPSQHQNQLAPIIICLLDQIRHHTYQRHPNWPPLLYALDETANIAPLPDLPAILAEGGSQGLVTITSLQDLNQARARWGPAADGFLTLHAAKIALGGIADPTTLRALSYLAGTIDLTYSNKSGQRSLFGNIDTNWNHTTQQRPRMPPEHINTIPPGIAYLAHTHHTPRYITLQPPPPQRPDPWTGTWNQLKNTITRWLYPDNPNHRKPR